jgi:hypothetical protein
VWQEQRGECLLLLLLLSSSSLWTLRACLGAGASTSFSHLPARLSCNGGPCLSRGRRPGTGQNWRTDPPVASHRLIGNPAFPPTPTPTPAITAMRCRGLQRGAPGRLA